MRYIVIFIISLLVFSCNENAERANTPYSNNDHKINSLFGEGDTVRVSGDATAGKMITPSGDKQLLWVVTKDLDTFYTAITQESRTLTYYVPLIDTFTKRYSGIVKPTDPERPTPDPGNYGTLILQSG